MPIDRQAKQKKKREEKRKTFHLEMVRLQQRGKLEEYEWIAQQAFKEKDYPAALGYLFCAGKDPPPLPDPFG